MRTVRDVEKMVSRMSIKKGQKRVVVQYGRGMLTGMHIAYVCVARKMLRQGRSSAEVKRFFREMTDASERTAILKDAKGWK